MRWRAVEVKVVFLDVLTVVAFRIREPEKPLFQDRIFVIPQGQREAKQLMVIRNSAQPVFSPAIWPGAGLIVAEVCPGVTVFTIIFADSPPLALTEIRPPFLPFRILDLRLL